MFTHKLFLSLKNISHTVMFCLFTFSQLLDVACEFVWYNSHVSENIEFEEKDEFRVVLPLWLLVDYSFLDEYPM